MLKWLEPYVHIYIHVYMYTLLGWHCGFWFGCSFIGDLEFFLFSQHSKIHYVGVFFTVVMSCFRPRPSDLFGALRRSQCIYRGQVKDSLAIDGSFVLNMLSQWLVVCNLSDGPFRRLIRTGGEEHRCSTKVASIPREAARLWDSCFWK